MPKKQATSKILSVQQGLNAASSSGLQGGEPLQDRRMRVVQCHVKGMWRGIAEVVLRQARERFREGPGGLHGGLRKGVRLKLELPAEPSTEEAEHRAQRSEQDRKERHAPRDGGMRDAKGRAQAGIMQREV